MKTSNLLSQDDKTVRTQITLTEKLKQLVENKALEKGISLSEYLRRAAVISLLVEEDEKQELARLADMVIGSVSPQKNPYWKNKKLIKQWVRNLRSEWE
ncbi:hypothetical protein HYW87_02445 [Candidatus Roizmanbacteria bacterium]|nr:hypothetical protein [Candidatus Roizmanbacteria bacterium]